MTDPLVDRLIAIVSRIAGPQRTPPEVGIDTRIWGGGFWLDSIELLYVLLACDESFGDGGEGHPPRPEVLATIGSLAESIRGRTRR